MNDQQSVNDDKRLTRTVSLELIIIFILGIAVYLISSHYDLLELLIAFLHNYEEYELDEFLILSLFFVFALAFFSVRRWREQIFLSDSLRNKNDELQKALLEIGQLRDILPICSYCKKIRDDEGYWHQVESYIRDNTGTEFSHGICPDCIGKLYSDLDKEKQGEN